MLDYLDSRGVLPNFLTGRPYSSSYRKVAAEVWSQLPVYKDRSKVKEIVQSLKKNSVTIVISATGSGKSVVVPRLAMQYLISDAKYDTPRLAMTFPKSVLASQSALFACKTWDVVLGEHVGFQFRGAPPSSHNSDTSALFLTDGTLFTMSRRDPLFSRFNLVIIDEAHERSVQTDFLLERLRQALVTRPTFRLVIMSATIDPLVFVNYFKSLPTAVVTVAGKPSFEITHHWEIRPVAPDVLMAVALQRAFDALDLKKKISKISKKKAKGQLVVPTDVLVFVPTTKDAIKGCKLLSDSKSPVRSTILCEGLYRKLPDALKDIVILGRPTPPMSRKLIYATPIAESSITLSLLAAVVDSGLQLSSTWLPLEQATRVTREMTSKAQISQRIGRVGRVAPGDAFHLYTENMFMELKDFPEPAISHTDLTEHFLAELCTGKTVDVVWTDCSHLITPPSPQQTASCVHTLQMLGLVTRGGGVSDLGRNIQGMCDMFKTSLSGALLLMGGLLVGCRKDAIVLSSILEEVKGQMTELWAINVLDPRVPLRAHCDKLSDHVSLIRIYREVYVPSKKVAVDALFIDMWNRIHTRIMRDSHRYLHFKLRIDAGESMFRSAAPPSAELYVSFSDPMIRAVAFARRHRQLVFKNTKGVDASSFGPLKSCTCTSRSLLATSETRPQNCVGGLYDELIEVGGKKSFSGISWIC